eukprot:scaffold33108_cov129-Isochrysis_galbana.AAC.4
MEATAVGNATRINVLMACVVRISKRRLESRLRATPAKRFRVGRGGGTPALKASFAAAAAAATSAFGTPRGMPDRTGWPFP